MMKVRILRCLDVSLNGRSRPSEAPRSLRGRARVKVCSWDPNVVATESD